MPPRKTSRVPYSGLRTGARREAVLGNRIAILQTLPNQADREDNHLVLRIGVPHVVLPRELGDVALEVLGAELVERAFVGAFKEAPKALDPGRVRHVADVLTSRVPDRFVVREPLVSTVVIGIDHRTWYGVAFDKPLQRRRVGMLDDACGHAVRLPILRANHGGFSHRSAPRVELLPLVFIALLAADIGFIHFDRAGEGVAGWRDPRFADAMQHDPGGRLGHADIAMELHAGNALQAREFERHRKGPLPQRDMRSFQDGAPVRTLKYDRQSVHQ